MKIFLIGLLLLIASIGVVNAASPAKSENSANNSCSSGNFSHLRDVNGKLLNKGFHPTSEWGLNIHNGCFSKFNASREETVKILERGFDKGAQCLKKLLEKNNEKQKNAINKHRIEMYNILGKQKNLKVLCDDKRLPSDSDFEAYASRRDDKIENYNGEGEDIGYPYISLSPKTCQKDHGSIANTLFHEVFHVMGYSHGQGVEYAYACADYCFSKNQDQQTKKLGAKICTLDENDYNQEEYIKDLVAYATLRNDKELNRNVYLRLFTYLEDYPTRYKSTINNIEKLLISNVPLLAKKLQHIRENGYINSSNNLSYNLAKITYLYFYKRHSKKSINAIINTISNKIIDKQYQLSIDEKSIINYILTQIDKKYSDMVVSNKIDEIKKQFGFMNSVQ